MLHECFAGGLPLHIRMMQGATTSLPISVSESFTVDGPSQQTNLDISVHSASAVSQTPGMQHPPAAPTAAPQAAIFGTAPAPQQMSAARPLQQAMPMAQQQGLQKLPAGVFINGFSSSGRPPPYTNYQVMLQQPHQAMGSTGAAPVRPPASGPVYIPAQQQQMRPHAPLAPMTPRRVSPMPFKMIAPNSSVRSIPAAITTRVPVAFARGTPPVLQRPNPSMAVGRTTGQSVAQGMPVNLSGALQRPPLMRPGMQPVARQPVQANVPSTAVPNK